jgi:RimJ/RimL family protein N-acetyltransferase
MTDMTASQPDVTELRTQRLQLRAWCEADREPWAALNADPEVRRFFPDTLDRAESDASMDRFQAGLLEHGYGLWAVQVRSTGEFAGFVGLLEVPPELPCAPAMEIGWRLARAFWGQGLATEAARAVVDHAFGTLGFSELVSLTTVTNLPSRRVMEKIGMTWDPASDYEDPRSPGWWGAPHVVYRLSAPDHNPRG